MKRVRLAGMALAVLGVSAALTACSSSGGGGTTVTSTGTPATGEPIVIGYVSSDDAAFGVPEATTATDAAVAYLNANGGIKGRPLELKKCLDDGTPAGATKCANELVTAKVPTVLAGLDLGIDSALQIYDQADIPIFSVSGSPGLQADAKHTVIFPPLQAGYWGIIKNIKAAGATSVLFVLPDIGPQIQQQYKILGGLAEADGMTAKLSLVSPTSPDWTASVNAAKSADADAIFLAASETECATAVRTIRPIFKGAIAPGTCSQFVGQVGADAKDVLFVGTTFPPSARAAAEKFNPELKSDFDAFDAALDAAGKKELKTSGYASNSYAAAATLGQILATVPGEITATSVRDTFSTYKGRAVLGLEINCAAKLAPGAGCGQQILAFEGNGDGTASLVGGKPLDISDFPKS